MTGTGSEPDTIRSADGRLLTLRPIRPDDAEALDAFHGRLSADTIYRRYFGPRPLLSPADVHRFTNVDGRVRFALVAVHGVDLVAVARYEGQPGRTDAEIAIIVGDGYQHRGIGRLMLSRLVDVARATGLHTLVAEVLASNAAMLRLLTTLDVPSTVRRKGETATVVLDMSGLDLSPDRRRRAEDHLARAASTRSAP